MLSILALPPHRMIGASAPGLVDRSMSSPSGNINTMVSSDHHRNPTASIPIPEKTPISSWAVECGQDTVPSGWAVPPEKHQVATPMDCRHAIYRVIRGGDPLRPQIWTSQADWSYLSCGVFLIPGWSYARVNVPRIDLAGIAEEIAQKCVAEEYHFMGGWVAIGELFIVLLTGKVSSTRQLSGIDLGSSQS